MKKRTKETYMFPQIDKKQYLIGWIIIIPLYLYIIKNWLIIPLAKILLIDTTAETFLPVMALIRNAVILMIIIVVFRRYILESFKEIRKHRLRNIIRWLGKGIKYYFVGCIINGLVYVLLRQIIEINLIVQTPQNQVLVDVFFVSNLFLAVLSDAMIAPIVEEFIFRVIIFHTLRKVHPVVAVAGSSLVFGMLHVSYEIAAGNIQAFIYIIPYIATAGALSLLYEKRRNIILCIVLHAVMNLISLII